jgi:hypothetical protein
MVRDPIDRGATARVLARRAAEAEAMTRLGPGKPDPNDPSVQLDAIARAIDALSVALRVRGVKLETVEYSGADSMITGCMVFRTASDENVLLAPVVE